MDKYEYKVRADEIKELIARGEYVQAADIADAIDWRRVKSVMMLCTISDLYKINRRYEDAKNLLLLAYERRPGGRTICYSLCELCIKTEEFVQAVDYYKQYVQAAPKDSGRYILQYKLYEAQDVSLEERISVLEELKKRDYREKWAYELAYLYHRVGLATKCVEECDELILWFGDGKYVVKAMELKMLHQPLTPEQQEYYDHRFDPPEASAQDAVPAKEQSGVDSQDYFDVQSHVPGIQDSASHGGAGTVQGDTIEYEGLRRFPEGHQEQTPLETPKAVEQPEELDIQVKIMDMGQYNTIDMQAEQAALVREVMGDDWNKSEEITRSIIAPMLDTETLDDPQIEDEDINENDVDNGVETIESTEVFFGETGEIASLQSGRAEETLKEMEADGGALQDRYESEEILPDMMEASPISGKEAEQKPLSSAEQVPEYAEVTEVTFQEEPPAEGKGDVLQGKIPVEGKGEVHQEEASVKGKGEALQEETSVEGKGETIQGKILTEGKAQNRRDDTAETVMSQLRLESFVKAEELVRIAQPPKELAEVLSQEPDGQLSLVMPERETVEKQITGQMSIQDILTEWERMKKEGEERRKEEVRQRVLRQTGNMFTEFEASVRDGLLEKLENGTAEDEPARDQNALEDVSLVMEENSGEISDESAVPDLEESNESEDVEVSQTESKDSNDAVLSGEGEERETLEDEAETWIEGDDVNAGKAEAWIGEENGSVEEAGAWTEGEEIHAGEEDASLEDILENVPLEVEGGEDFETSGEDEPCEEDYLGEVEELEEIQEEFLEDITDGESIVLENTEDKKKGIKEDRTGEEVDLEKAGKSTALAKARKDTVSEDADGMSPVERDTAKIRPLTREEKELFAPYIQSKSAREQLVKTIDNISMASYTGNVIITGDEGMDTSTLAKNLIREVQVTDSNFSGDVAKISGQGLNSRDVAATLQQLKNGALIIQKASGMNKETAAALHRQLQGESLGIIIVMEDTKKGISRLLQENEELGSSFTARMEVQALSNDMLVAFGRQYAREIEYFIDELGVLALHTRIEEMQTIDHAVTVTDVKEIVDKAIRHANRKTVGHFVDILLGKRYDQEDMIILTEKDFD